MIVMSFRIHSCGSALLICMLLLTALTLLGLAAASDAGLQSRMIGNQDMTRRTTGHADAALRWAESWLLGLEGEARPTPCSDSCEAGQVVRLPGVYPETPEHETSAWWQANGFRAGHDPESGIALDPALATVNAGWIIEEIHFTEAGDDGIEQDIAYYRVMSRAPYPASHRAVVVESVLARPWGDSSWSDGFPPAPGQTAICRQPGAPQLCGRMAWQMRR